MAKVDFRISKKSLDKVLKLEKDFKDKMDELSLEIGDELFKEVKNQLIKTNTVASGDLFRSITSDIIIKPQSRIVEVGSPLRYSKQAEEGRKPGSRPSPARILKWMKAKGVPGNIDKAIKIANKIKAEGYRGKRFFERAFIIVNERVESIAVKVFRKGLGD